MRWIIGIVVVVVIVILGYQYFGGSGDMDVAEQTEESADQAAQQTEEAAEATGQAVEETVEATEETAEQAAEATQETVEEAAEATQETTEEAAAGAEQATEQAAEATEEAATDVAGAVEEATETASEEVTGEAAQVTQEATDQTQASAEQAAEVPQPAVEEALTEAQTAALTVGDVNVGEKLTEVVQSAEESLQGITDAQSAEAAVPTLNDINAQLEELSATVDQLPEEAKKVLADLLGERVTELKTLADSVTSQEGVGEVVTPALEPIMAKLDDWAQQPA